ncbi:hypothetical protein IP87_14145 [beta proteobacterium AAP121]|nr:hypothetical protein IP80_15650 [beta proteobacterium AAP65]KPF96410.1 hypothetical protein IP87_14145 [beta proteobacterium AAP121]
MADDSIAWLRGRLAAAQFTPSEAETFISQMPSRRAGRARAFGDFIHRLSRGDGQVFQLTQRLAERVDVLCEELVFAHDAENLSAFKSVLLDNDWLRDQHWCLGTEAPSEQVRQKVVEARDWQALDEATKVPFANVWLSFMAAIDLEFAQRHFEFFAPRPLFLDLLPTLGPTVEMGAAEIELPRRDRFRLPTRRLLELCFALLHYRAHRVWPSSPPTRKEIARASGYRDVDIGNFYDGTKKLTAKVFGEWWATVARDFATSSEVVPPSPTPLLMAALAWHSGMVAFDARSKVRQMTLFDGGEYLSWWHAHQQDWGAELSAGTVEWPGWLDGPPDVPTDPVP